MIIRTVLGDIAPNELGLTLAHEHLIARLPADVADDDLRLDDEEAAIRELASFRDAGGGAVVEMTTVDYGRDVAALQRVSQASAVHVVAATGFNKGRFADRIVERHGGEEIVAWMIAEVSVGAVPYMEPERVALSASGARVARDVLAQTGLPAARAGLIKASTSLGGPGEHELRVLESAVAAHLATGAPVSTHTERATWALEQARFLVDGGVPAGKVLIGHCDFRPEPAFLLELADTGVNIGLDQFSKSKYLPDEARVQLVADLASEGHLGQILLSGDLARKSYWPAYGFGGAKGFSHIPTTVAGMLRAAGLNEADVELLLRGNAQRWLRFEPAKA